MMVAIHNQLPSLKHEENDDMVIRCNQSAISLQSLCEWGQIEFSDNMDLVIGSGHPEVKGVTRSTFLGGQLAASHCAVVLFSLAT